MFTFISGAMCCLSAMVIWGTNSLIRKHSLHLPVWKCWSTCPNLLIDLSHLILKYVVCVFVWGFTSSRFGHIGHQLMLVGQHQSGIAPHFLLMELILGMHIYVWCWTLHCMLTMSVLLVYLQISYSACTFIVYIFKVHVLVWLSFASRPALM